MAFQELSSILTIFNGTLYRRAPTFVGGGVTPDRESRTSCEEGKIQVNGTIRDLPWLSNRCRRFTPSSGESQGD